MATRPTTVPDEFGTNAGVRVAPTPERNAEGFPAGGPVGEGVQTYLHGTSVDWVRYVAELSPASDVLAFREWRCIDNASFNLEWSSSTDGRMDGTLSVLSLTANDATDGALVRYSAGTTFAFVQLEAGGATLQTNVAGSNASVRSANSAGTEGARVQCDADSRDIDIISTDGNVTIDAGGGAVDVTGAVDITGTLVGSSSASFTGNVVSDRYRYQSATTFTRNFTPAQYADADGTGSNDIASFTRAGWAVEDPGSLADGDVLCWGLLGGLEPAVVASAVPTFARVFWRQVAGTGGVTLELVAVAAGGGETVVASGDLPDSTTGDQTTDLSSLAGSIQVPETYFLRASSKGGSAATVKVFGVLFQYTRTDAR